MISKRLFLSLILLHFCVNAISQTKLPSYFWPVSGVINKIIRQGDIIYAGGRFNYAGPQTGNGVELDRSTGQLLKNNFPVINGTVYKAVADDKGGIFIGGSFTNVGGLKRNRLAHIDANGNVTSWDPGANYIVYTMAKSVNKLYVGGDFDSIGGQARSKLASIDVTTGNVTSWKPLSNGTVSTIAVSGNIVYAGGTFTKINNQTRTFIAAIDTSSGLLTNWAPYVAGSRVYSIIISGKKIYVGGNFNSINNKNRNSIAVLEAGTDSVFVWNPNIMRQNKLAGSVSQLTMAGSNIYALGSFDLVGSTLRKNIAAIDTATGQATSWIPAINNYIVSSITIAGDTAFIGASSINTGSKIRYYIGAVDLKTGNALDWGPRSGTNSIVYPILLFQNKVFIGGTFSSAGGYERKNLAAFDVKTGEVTAWSPKVNGEVKTILLSENNLYIGGEFDTIQSEFRYNIGCIDISSGNVTSWDPYANDYVTDMKLIGKTLYISGNFRHVGFSTRNKLAAVDINTGKELPWNPDCKGVVYCLGISDNTIYAGGDFDQIGTEMRKNIAAIDATTGNVKSSWRSDLQLSVGSMEIAGDTVFAVGNGVGTFGINKKVVNAINTDSGTIYNWGLDIYSSWGDVVRSLLIKDSIIYVAGAFDSIDGIHRKNLVSVNKRTGKATSWAPSTPWVNYLYSFGDTLYTLIGAATGTIEHYSFRDLPSRIYKNEDRISGVTVFPNPSKGIFTYQFINLASEGYSIQVYDVMGKIVNEKQESMLPVTSNSINLQGNAPGIYLLKIQSGKYVITKKLILEK